MADIPRIFLVRRRDWEKGSFVDGRYLLSVIRQPNPSAGSLSIDLVYRANCLKFRPA
jgi:hypothetical protein